MNKKLKFLLLKILLLLFLILPLPIEAVFFLGTTIRLNFETTITGDSLNPKFHITSLIPTITDRSISLPNIKQVTISQIGPGDNYYKLKFELEGIDPQPPSVPTDKKTYEEVEKLLEEITDALQNNKTVSYELLSGKNIFSRLFISWSLISITILLILLFLFVKIRKAEKKTTE